jgi:hypothetical protein
MTRRQASIGFLLYALVVVGSAALRLLLTGSGTTGLWFGLAMGALALGSGAWLARSARRVAYLPGACALVLVGGWFAYECFVRSGWAQAELRQLAILALTIAFGLGLGWPKGRGDVAPHGSRARSRTLDQRAAST